MQCVCSFGTERLWKKETTRRPRLGSQKRCHPKKRTSSTVSPIPRINDSKFYYFPRFSSFENQRVVLSVLKNSHSTDFDHEFASPSDAGSDEIFEQLNDDNNCRPSVMEDDGLFQHWDDESNHKFLDENLLCPISVSNRENDGQIQFKRILQRPESVGVATRSSGAVYLTSQKPSFTRAMKGNDVNPRQLTHMPSFYCAFCVSNGETESFYSSHPLKDALNRVACPILRKYVCQKCGATGSSAHTNKYCPKNSRPLPKSKPIRRNAIGKKVVSYN
ncbi:hypothetical protein GE061_006415 [Apolygus lucorum]|uniref:Nanos-type domain-containing protein n=1 Tax=Apolygus lucorum TaxID=248454 RepID=A0A8S9WV73_APOLU|nr:hypothetical protein GE061_006415 [Apolygus lucorum]